MRSSGDVQPANASLSSLHSKVRSAARSTLSVPEKVNGAAVFTVLRAGLESIVVSGASTSPIVHVRLAGGSVTKPKRFVAVTSNVCSPRADASVPRSCASVYVTPEVHSVGPPPSSEHRYVTGDWSAPNVKVAVSAPVISPSAGPPVIVTTGGPATNQV